MRTVPDHIPRPDYASHPDGNVSKFLKILTNYTLSMNFL